MAEMLGSLLLLTGAGFLSGTMNAVAGGGSFVTLPTLILSGMDARAANITSTIALFPGQVTTGLSGRKMASGTERLSFKPSPIDLLAEASRRHRGSRPAGDNL